MYIIDKNRDYYADAVILFRGDGGTANMKSNAIKHNLKILYEEK